ncbi:MAG: ATP-binding protein [Pseudomonadota bacterium]
MDTTHRIKQIIADFEVAALPRATRRTLALPSLPGKVDVVVGMRRTGKTWFLFQQIAALEARGVPRSRILYLNFDDERLRPLDASQLQLVPQALYERHPEIVDQETWYFFDEIQDIPGWELFIRRMIDSRSARVVLSGSSARLLGREIATSLRGRSLSAELLPFSFREYLVHHHIDPPERWPATTQQRALLAHHMGRYLLGGGFPEVQGLDARLRARILQDYVDGVLFRDVVERHEVTNVAALRYLVRRLVKDPAAAFSVNRFFNDLKSQGFRVSKDTLHAYLAHLEDAFLVFPVSIHARSERGRMVNPRKIYLADPALAVAHSFDAGADHGHLLENLVYIELRRRGYEVGYVRTSSGYEVDFLARRAGERPLLVQVCTEMSDPAVVRRELRALEEALREYGLESAVVVTLNEEGRAEVRGHEVLWRPAWEWLVRG